MSENAQAADAAAVEENDYSSVDYGAMAIGMLTAFVVGWFAFGVVSAIVIFIRSAGPPTGWSLQATMDSLQLVAPPGVSLAGIGFKLNPPVNETLDMVLNLLLDYGAYAVGLVIAIISYFKFMALDGSK